MADRGSWRFRQFWARGTGLAGARFRLQNRRDYSRLGATEKLYEMSVSSRGHTARPGMSPHTSFTSIALSIQPQLTPVEYTLAFTRSACHLSPEGSVARVLLS